MSREDALLRLQMASAALYRAGTRLPRVRRVTDLVKYAKACNSLQLAELGAAMGALLDGNGSSAEAAENVANVLSQPPRPEPPPQAAEPPAPPQEAPPPPPAAEEPPQSSPPAEPDPT
jgi:type IV secretory pathway VirB10-like protein